MGQILSSASATDQGERVPVAELLDLWTYEVRRHIDEVRIALPRENRNDLKRAVRGLVACCNGVGSVSLHRICTGLETLAPSATVETLNRLLDQIEVEFERSCRDLISRLVA